MCQGGLGETLFLLTSHRRPFNKQHPLLAGWPSVRDCLALPLAFMRDPRIFWNLQVSVTRPRFAGAQPPALGNRPPVPSARFSRPHGAGGTPPGAFTGLCINLRQSVFLQFGNNNNYMNMAEANNAFFAASEVGACLHVSLRVLCVI